MSVAQKRRIQRLPAEVVGRIAAGEMISRPAAAVKELIENALDAQAGRITLRVTEGVDRCIEIADDGAGIAREELALALERYTTSKISGEEDLLRVETLGFRGEALAAIAEIARVTLISRTPDGEHAWQVRAEGGRIGPLEAAARAPGTTVIVEDIFYNTPVRKRFLKTGPAEMRLVREMVQAYGQAFPGLSWKLSHDERILIEYAAVPDLRTRLSQVHGTRVGESLHPVESREGGLGLHGFVGGPELARTGTRHQVLFVNGRWVVSPWLFQAVRHAFGDVIASHQSPWAVLLLTVPPAELDVNLHPTKREVRFLDDRVVFAFVQRSVRPAVARLVPRFFLGGEGGMSPASAAGGRTPGRADEGGGRDASHAGPGGSAGGFAEGASAGAQRRQAREEGTPWDAPRASGTAFFSDMAHRLYGAPGLPEGSPAAGVWEGPGGLAGATGELPRERTYAEESGPGRSGGSAARAGAPDELISLWQLHNRYVLAQTRKGLLIIDQHAAHERILYERIRERMQSTESPAQQLLFPAFLEVTLEEMEIYREHQAVLARMGFDCQDLDERSVLVRGVPPLWRSRSEAQLLRDLLAEAGAMGLREGETLEGLARAFACQAAIKANEPLSVEEMNRLVDELFATQLPHGDPHGRPTFVFLSLSDLDRRFGRSGGG